jgi:hypothetical protein
MAQICYSFSFSSVVAYYDVSLRGKDAVNVITKLRTCLCLIPVHHALRILWLPEINEFEPNFNERPKVETVDSPVVYRAKVVDVEFVVSACFANNFDVSSLQSVILYIQYFITIGKLFVHLHVRSEIL